jgi:hypothetical protein
MFMQTNTMSGDTFSMYCGTFTMSRKTVNMCQITGKFGPLVDVPDRSRRLGLGRCNHLSSKWCIGIHMCGVLVYTCVVCCIGIHTCGVVYWYTHVCCGVLVYTCVVWCIGIHMRGVMYWYTHVWCGVLVYTCVVWCVVFVYTCVVWCMDIHMCCWYNTNVIACVVYIMMRLKSATPYKLKRNADLLVNRTMTLLHFLGFYYLECVYCCFQ